MVIVSPLRIRVGVVVGTHSKWPDPNTFGIQSVRISQRMGGPVGCRMPPCKVTAIFAHGNRGPKRKRSYSKHPFSGKGNPLA